MELSDSFEVNHSIATVWDVLTDVERIAPCLPGAQLTGREGDEYQGVVKVKVGPVTSQYKGKATFEELDHVAHRAVIAGAGRDTRGAGNASAKITVQLEAVDDSSTKVSVNTDLTITGKVAQFGRGVMADVSRKLMGQFAANLATLIDEINSEATGITDTPATDESAGAGAAGAGTVAAAESPDDSADRAAAAPAAAAPAAAPASAGATGAAGSAGASSASSGPGAGSGGHEADDVEAVDLLAVAGGSVMKRLIPVLVVVAVVVIVLVVII